MYHPPSRRRQIWTRIIVYSAMNIAIVLLVGISLLYTLGYRFDSKAQKVEQSGLVQLISLPPGAAVKVDGVSEGTETPTKSVVLPGTHEFSMQKTGYEQWRKSLDIASGTLTWLSYARLVPKKLTVEEVHHMTTLTQTLSSPDKRFMAAVTDSAQPSFTVFDLTTPDVRQSVITLTPLDYAEADTEGVAHQFVLKEWDKNGRFILVEHLYGEKKEWLVVDRQDAALESNIARFFTGVIDEAHFSEGDAMQMFVHTNGEVRRLNLSAKTVSAPLLSRVIEFHVTEGDLISYVSWTDDKKLSRHVGAMRSGKAGVIVYTSSLDPAVPLHVTASNYFHKDYFVVSEGANLYVYAGDFPNIQSEATKLGKPKTLTAMSDITSLGMNNSGRFVLAGYDTAWASYDLERSAFTRVIGLSHDGTVKKFNWLDDYYLWSDQGGNLVMREFDGANAHIINPVAPGFDVTVSQNGTYLYSIGQTKNGFQLQRVKMIL